MIKLYQFPISHFCEKIRWALDYKSIDHDVINLVPGLHIKQMEKLGFRSSVPAIDDLGKFVQGSTEIIGYLDEQFPNDALTPTDDVEKAQALEWEAYLEKEIGVTVRLCLYHILLEHPEIVKPFFAHQGPWYANLYLAVAFPKIRKAMRHFMKINDETAKEAKEKLVTAIEKLTKHYQQHNYLVADQFSRADLTAAALLAPITMQEEYGLDWPEELPSDLTDFIDDVSGDLTWVNRLYKKHR